MLRDVQIAFTLKLIHLNITLLFFNNGKIIHFDHKCNSISYFDMYHDNR